MNRSQVAKMITDMWITRDENSVAADFVDRYMSSLVEKKQTTYISTADTKPVWEKLDRHFFRNKDTSPVELSDGRLLTVEITTGKGSGERFVIRKPKKQKE